MTLELIIAFNLALLAAIASPGPAFLVSVRTSIVRGRFAGMLTGIGLGFMSSMWTLAALLGLNGVFQLFPWAYTGAKLIGAGYLFYIAWNTWKNASLPLSNEANPTNRYFLDGVLLNLSNPKSVLFAAAVLIVIFPPYLSLYEKAFIVMNHFVVEVLCYALIAFVMSTEVVSRKYLAAKTWADRISSTVMAGLGLRLLLDR